MGASSFAIFATVEILYVVQGGRGGTRGVIRLPAQSDDWANSYDAVGVRFELTRVLPLMVFKTISLNRSDTPPNFKVFLPSGDPPQGDKTGALNHYAKPP